MKSEGGTLRDSFLSTVYWSVSVSPPVKIALLAFINSTFSYLKDLFQNPAD